MQSQDASTNGSAKQHGSVVPAFGWVGADAARALKLLNLGGAKLGPAHDAPEQPLPPSPSEPHEPDEHEHAPIEIQNELD